MPGGQSARTGGIFRKVLEGPCVPLPHTSVCVYIYTRVDQLRCSCFCPVDAESVRLEVVEGIFYFYLRRTDQTAMLLFLWRVWREVIYTRGRGFISVPEYRLERPKALSRGKHVRSEAKLVQDARVVPCCLEISKSSVYSFAYDSRTSTPSPSFLVSGLGRCACFARAPNRPESFIRGILL